MIYYTQAILDVYEILLSDKYNQSYIKHVLALPSFITWVGLK